MRILMGIVWFVVIFLVLYIAFSVIVGVMIFNSGHVGTTHEQVESVIAFSREHARILSLCRWGIVLMSIVAAAFGTWKRVLPGTRKKISVPAPGENQGN